MVQTFRLQHRKLDKTIFYVHVSNKHALQKRFEMKKENLYSSKRTKYLCPNKKSFSSRKFEDCVLIHKIYTDSYYYEGLPLRAQ